ncbi:citrate synthase [Actinomadura roseirufa]|uniref:citrate synthase n=1 Tax=Actinomadura roseirufa TaxID=2094049 RepID=UPI0010419BA5|nr:citrate synthase [Actinomadura roseirufa]
MDGEAESDAERLTTQEVADRLGVKVETVYAYASRGLLRSMRTPGSRHSTFDAGEVERLAERGQRSRPAHAGFAEAFPEILTSITRIRGGRLYFRGHDAVDLAAREGFETAAEWVWTGRAGSPEKFEALPGQLAAVSALVAALPEGTASADRLRLAVAGAGAADPLRFDLRPEIVLAAGRAIVSVLVHALGDAGRRAGDEQDGGVAMRLWNALASPDADLALVRALETALVLLLDHDLAVSTLAARVTASARANPYAVVSAGLGALDGPLHGAAGGNAHQMLATALDQGNAVAVISDHLRTGRPVPGLGHPLYPQGDPRARALFDVLGTVPSAAPYLEVVEQISDAVAHHAHRRPNVDLALAALCLAAGMRRDAPEAIFGVARAVGWVAHAQEEYQESALRFRVRSQYSEHRPGDGEQLG